jgi:hypothetical protein
MSSLFLLFMVLSIARSRSRQPTIAAVFCLSGLSYLFIYLYSLFLWVLVEPISCKNGNEISRLINQFCEKQMKQKEAKYVATVVPP